MIVIHTLSVMGVKAQFGPEDSWARTARLSIVGTFSIPLPCDYSAEVFSGSIHWLFSSAAIIIRVE